MTDLLIMLVVNSLLICGLHISICWEGMVLSGAKHWLDDLPDWIRKPLYDCPICMASIHSTYFFWLLMPATSESLLMYVFYIPALAGLNALIYRHIE